MGCRGIIARQQGDGFSGVYHHNDSKPTGLGKALWHLYHGHFEGDIEKMLKFLLDEHRGWSTIVGANFKRKPRWIGARGANYNSKNGYQPICYCHGDTSHGTVDRYTDADGTDCEWCYVFNVKERLMTIMEHTGFEGGDWQTGRDLWKAVAVIALDDELEPIWELYS